MPVGAVADGDASGRWCPFPSSFPGGIESDAIAGTSWRHACRRADRSDDPLPAGSCQTRRAASPSRVADSPGGWPDAGSGPRLQMTGCVTAVRIRATLVAAPGPIILSMTWRSRRECCVGSDDVAVRDADAQVKPHACASYEYSTYLLKFFPRPLIWSVQLWRTNEPLYVH
jgi:hypothetical protein